MRKLVIAVSVMALAVAMCILSSSLADESDAAYEERTLTVYLYSMDNPGELDCRFYDDMPSTPYVRFEDVFNIYSGVELDVEDNGGGKFTMTNTDGVSVVIDIENDTVSSDDYHAFTYFFTTGVHWTEEEGKDPKALITRYATETVVAPARTVFDLSAYGLDIRGEGEVWMPVTTASDLVCGPGMFYTVYSGVSFYCFYIYNFLDGSLFPDPMWDEILDWIEDSGGVRPDDLTEYSYNELQFRMDVFWGNVERTDFSRMAASVGLDEALEKYSDGSRAVKEMLLDPSIEVYAVGLKGLASLVQDGGHTVLDASSYAYVGSIYPDFEEYAEERLSGLSLPEAEDRFAISDNAKQARAEAWGEGDYHSRGDTAVYTMDAFDSLWGWDEYYANGGDYPDDTVGNLLRAMDMASADPKIRNFIIDLTTCDGGDVDVMLIILAMISGCQPDQCYTDPVTGAKYVDRVHVDVNLDGRYDERDLHKRCDLNFAILTSELSFSSGNSLPILAKEVGVTIIGERSGGGCAALMSCCTPEGFVQTLSSYFLQTSSDFDTIAFDSGAEPDVKLDVPERDGMPDYSSFYDITMLSRIMYERYPPEDAPSEIAVILAAAIIILAALLLIGGIRR